MSMFAESSKKDRPVAFIPGKTKQDNKYINLDENGSKEVFTSKSKLHLMPTRGSSGRKCVYVAGASGSGKSYWTAQYIRDWIAFNNQKTNTSMCYIFSALSEDEVFDKIIASHKEKVHRVNIGPELFNNPIDIGTEIEKGSLLVFDDIDTLPNKLRKGIYELINQILQIGRHYDFSIVITSHLINGMDRNFNRIVMNECHYVVLFLQGLARRHVHYWAETYAGIDKDDLKNMYKLASRATIFSKNYPQFYMTEHKLIPVHFN